LTSSIKPEVRNVSPRRQRRTELAAATGNTQRKFGEDRTCSSEDTIAVRQTHTHTDTLITILRFAIGGRSKNSSPDRCEECRLATSWAPCDLAQVVRASALPVARAICHAFCSVQPTHPTTCLCACVCVCVSNNESFCNSTRRRRSARACYAHPAATSAIVSPPSPSIL